MKYITLYKDFFSNQIKLFSIEASEHQFLEREWTQEDWDLWLSGAWGQKENPIEAPAPSGVKKTETMDTKDTEGTKDLGDPKKAAERLEELHQDWNSSEASTAKPGSAWEGSGEESLEDKFKRVGDPKQDGLPVATQHEINKEKEARRAEKKRKLEASLQWSPITKQGYDDFVLHCQGGTPVVERLFDRFNISQKSHPKKKRFSGGPSQRTGAEL